MRAMHMQGWRENGTNLRQKLGLDNQRRIGGEVALAENLPVAAAALALAVAPAAVPAPALVLASCRRMI